jgi:spermidine/putrescine transport system permease protein
MFASRPFIIKKMPGFAAIALVMFVILYLPIMLLIIYSFNERESVAVWGGFSLRWYQSAWPCRGTAWPWSMPSSTCR